MDQLSPDDLAQLQAAQQAQAEAAAVWKHQCAYLTAKYGLTAADALDVATGTITRKEPHAPPEIRDCGDELGGQYPPTAD